MSDNNGLEPKAPVARTESVGSLDFHPSSKEEHKKSRSSLNNQQMEDSGEVKFSKDSVEGKGDAAVEIGAVPQPFAGMGKDELMKYANDPFWVRLRWALFILFWLAWLGMLAAAIAIIIMAPKCPAPTPLEYWQEAPVYHVLPRTFEKSPSGLKGITSRLSHFIDLGAKVVLLSSIFKSNSPLHEGYDTIDFKAVDPVLGSMEDFEALVKAADAMELKIVLDMVPNHSSDEHQWFKDSVKGTKPYDEYYVWRNCTEDKPPNNWLAVTGEAAWTWNADRSQCYLHQFGKGRPDFNFYNSAVQQELLNDTLQFWIDHGVAGFRMGAVQHLYEDEKYEDEPGNGSSYDSLNHTYTVNHPKNLEVLKKIRSLLDSNKFSDDKRRILLTDTDQPITDLIQFYGSSEEKLVDIPLNHQLIKDLNKGFDAKTLNQTVNDVLEAVTTKAWPNWVLSTSRNSRSASRLGTPSTNALALIQMTLRGTPVIYYGEEIGMQDVGADVPKTLSYEPACGDMDWNEVEAQRTSNNSRFTVYKSLGALRKSDSILYGETAFVDGGQNIFAFTRIRKGAPGYLVIANFGNETRYVNLEGRARLPKEMTLEIRTAESNLLGVALKDKVPTANVTLEGYEGLVLSFVPEKE